MWPSAYVGAALKPAVASVDRVDALLGSVTIIRVSPL
jgi:hypothetical protein